MLRVAVVGPHGDSQGGVDCNAGDNAPAAMSQMSLYSCLTG
jgi:hypothetical protein